MLPPGPNGQSTQDDTMSAIPEDFVKKTAQLSEEATRPFGNSKKADAFFSSLWF